MGRAFGDDASSPPAESTETFREYRAGDGVMWRAQDFDRLSADLGVVELELPEFHALLCPLEREWNIVRMLYGIARLTGETNMLYFTGHSREDVASRLSMSAGQIDAEIAAIQARWKRRQVGVRREETTIPVDAPLTEDRIKSLLEKNGFSDVEGDDRAFVASRCIDLQHKLDDEEGRVLAREAIRAELSLATFGKILSQLNAELLKADTSATRREGIRKDIADFTKQQTQVRSSYKELMTALESTQAQRGSVKEKVAFQKTLSIIMEAARDYVADEDNTLVDGVHTQAEIELLCTPRAPRPPQYRLDLVALIRDAVKEENLFNRDYVPPTMPRGLFRRFRAAIKKGLEALDPDEEVEDLADDEMDDDDSGGGPAESGGIPSLPSDGVEISAPEIAPAVPIRSVKQEAAGDVVC